MSTRTLCLDDTLYAYMMRFGVREPELLTRLREETAADPQARMQTAPEQGQLLQLLVRLIGARCCLEVGVYTGYSSLWTALALPDDGELIACDISEGWTAIARRYWQAAGVDHKVELRLGPAAVTLQGLIGAGRVGRFDFAFVDADKESYPLYYEYCLTLLRPGGLLAFDNVFWGGAVADKGIGDDRATTALRDLNARIHADPRVEMAMLPIGDGMTLVRKT